MTAPTAAPDTVLAGRYRLLRARALGAETGSGDLWRAQDEVLARPVSVRVLPAADDRAEALLAAAGRAGRLTDTRLARVLDAAEDAGYAFVVGEWIDGEPMGTTLRALGPFDPVQATGIVLEVARVVAAAHVQGLAHLHLHPGNVLLTASGEVKVTDLEIAAALDGTEEPDDVRHADARGLGLLLYAALTARWADGPAYGLPAAPRTADGRPASPRQVRAGISRELDAVVERCLSDPPRRGLDPIRTPSAVVAALAGLPQPRPSDEIAEAFLPRPPGRTRQVLRVALPLLTVAAVVVAGWLSGLALGRVPGQGPGFTSNNRTSPSPGGSAAPAITVAADAIRDYDPGGDGKENPDQAPYAIDGDTSTSWQTDIYKRRPDLGGLKSGVGLVVDLGRSRRVSDVSVLLTKPGADIEIRAGDEFAQTEAGFPLVASAHGAGSKPPNGQPRGTVVLRPSDGPVSARYWLVWLTKLPRDGADYREGIAELVFRR